MRINQVWQCCAPPPARLALSDALRRAPPSPVPVPALATALLETEAEDEDDMLAVRRYARQLLAGRDVHFSDSSNITNIQKVRLCLLLFFFMLYP